MTSYKAFHHRIDARYAWPKRCRNGLSDLTDWISGSSSELQVNFSHRFFCWQIECMYLCYKPKGSPRKDQLTKTVWERKCLSLEVKLKVCKVVVLPSLLYSCETWTVCSHHAKVLNRYHLNCLRRIVKITLHDKISDTEILQLAEITSILTIVNKNQLWWSGHVVRTISY